MTDSKDDKPNEVKLTGGSYTLEEGDAALLFDANGVRLIIQFPNNENVGIMHEGDPAFFAAAAGFLFAKPNHDLLDELLRRYSNKLEHQRVNRTIN